MIVKVKPLLRDEIRDRIAALIIESGLRAGDRLHSEKKLGELFGVNHLTIRAALAELAENGIVERRTGVGTFYTGYSGTSFSAGDSPDHSVPAHTAVPRSGTHLAAILLHAEKHFYDEFLHGITTVLQRQGYIPTNILLTGDQLDDENESLAGFERAFSLRPEIFLALQPAIEKTPALIEAFNRGAARVPKVIRLLGNGCCTEALAGHLIAIDHATMIRRVVAHLKGLGHRRIGYIGGNCSPAFLPSRANRHYAKLYASAMIEEELGPHINLFAPPSRDETETRRALREYLDVPPERRPTALVSIHDHPGILAIDTARELGLKVPEDLSVVGYYDTPWSNHYRMSTCRFPCEAMAERVSELVRNTEVKDGVTMLEGEYVERETVAPIA